ncbi:MAG: cytochrome c [Arcobacteraceae bacterium]|jgi:mono/diheme cytochrome c family protein|nr:cytochrome c [Arcobacteraceae bacterium]
MYKNPLLALVLTTSLFADVTMCYKENFTTPSKIETVTLDGGDCNGKYSVNDMKKSGWSIKDISTSKGENGMNYTYIFSKSSDVAGIPIAPISSEALKEQLTILDNQKTQKAKDEKENEALASGKKIYEKQCARCHGLNGELKPHTSDKLIGMSSEDFSDIMRAYGMHDRDKGAGILMSPYSLISSDKKDVIKYLESINVLVNPVKK